MTMLALFSVAAFAQNNTKETAPAAKEIKGTVFEKGTLKELLAKAAKEKKYLFVDVYATWCGPCRAFGPIFEAASNEPENANIAFVKVDIDANQDLAQAAGIQAVPTLMIAKQGEVIFQQAGALQAADLDDLITQAKALDLAAAKAAQSGADQQA
mgnify:CR=1 FL=1